MTTLDRPYWTIWVGDEEKPVTAAASPRFADVIRFPTAEEAELTARRLNLTIEETEPKRHSVYEVRAHSEKIRLAKRIHGPKGRPS